MRAMLLWSIKQFWFEIFWNKKWVEMAGFELGTFRSRDYCLIHFAMAASCLGWLFVIINLRLTREQIENCLYIPSFNLANRQTHNSLTLYMGGWSFFLIKFATSLIALLAGVWFEMAKTGWPNKSKLDGQILNTRWPNQRAENYNMAEKWTSVISTWYIITNELSL